MRAQVVVGTSSLTDVFSAPYFDKETNTHYNYFRDYDPGIGRYLQPDPLGIATTRRPTFTIALNHLYAYVGSNPLTFIDPLGLLRYGTPQYNAPPPRTAPLPLDVEWKVTCIELCLDVDLIVTGGAEHTGHTPGSRHYSGDAVDFGFASNPGIQGRSKDFLCCALTCGFAYGQTEYGRGPHYHIQIVPGLGVPRIPSNVCGC